MPDPYPCAIVSCAAECHMGSEFGCLGKYAPRLRDAADDTFDLSMAVSVYGGAAASDVRVTACNPFSVDCRKEDVIPGAVDVTDAEGRATLSWPMQGGTGFSGALAFEDERADAGSPDGGIAQGQLLPSRVVRTLPFIEARYGIQLPTINVFEIYLDLVHETFDPARAYAVARVLDCGIGGASGIEIKVSTEDARTRYYYWSDFVAREGLAETTRDGLVSIMALPPGGNALITATERSTGRVVARGRIVPLAGTYIYVDLFPLTEAQALEQFD